MNTGVWFYWKTEPLTGGNMRKLIVVGTNKQIAEGFCDAFWCSRLHRAIKIAIDDQDLNGNPSDLVTANLNCEEANLVLVHHFEGSRGLTKQIRRHGAKTIIVACGIGVEGEFDYETDTSDEAGRLQLSSLVEEFDRGTLRLAPITIDHTRLEHVA